MFYSFVILLHNYMTTALRPRTLILFVGDICFFIFALWLSLYLRAFEIPSQELFVAHLQPFSFLFVAWVVIFFIAGMYENRLLILARRALSATLLIAQTANVALAALFFFFIPLFGIAPKTVLVIYLVVSFPLVLCWRAFIFPKLFQTADDAVVLGAGAEIDELTERLNEAHRAPVRIVEVIRPNGVSIAEAAQRAIQSHNPRFIIADFSNRDVTEAFPKLINYLATGIRFIDAMGLYEEVFGRVPLTVLNEQWLARYVSRYSYSLYGLLKRVMDVIIALPAALISLIFYPFIAFAIKLQDGGPVFIAQERVGEDDRLVRIYKFRSMARNETDLSKGMERNRVTAVGSVLRLTRLDELPQLWAIVRGDLSFVGPRPELPSGVALYEQEIPFYNVRHLVRPGLSGWAQLYGEHGHHGVDLDTTKNKLSYDLYYIKHRSLVLDLTIALKTIKKLLTRSGV